MTSSRSDLAKMMPDAFPVFFTGRQPYQGQAMVMPEVVKGHNVLFAAPTASGKTEAIVAPLYQRHLSFKRKLVSTVYVAPTKALVNDIYERMITYLETRQAGSIARYTGDRHEFRTSAGAFCLLTTPEALDSLQIRNPLMLSGVRSIVVDEIHLLHGQPRGQQLRHVISRIKHSAHTPPSPRDIFQIVGMTATLDDMEGVAETWLGPGAKVISHGTPRDIDLQLIQINKENDPGRERARALTLWLTQNSAEKVLVFSNSRNGAHDLAANLHRELENTRWPVHLHFGALASNERERVEDEMRRQRYGVCVATTTLEIGIDIGDVDTVVLSDPPRSVSGFLQRIGRGNRRSDVCRVVAFRGSDEDEHLLRALLECGRRGELDDTHEYDRPSVRFQQIISLCWKATRHDHALSTSELCAEAGSPDHIPVINDMIEMGTLKHIRGALIPSDRLLDLADAGQIHSVIASRTGGAVTDIRTGETAMRDTDNSSAGGAIFHSGKMRPLVAGSDGDAYLGHKASMALPLARIRATGPALPVSRAVLWGIARQYSLDPTRWQYSEEEIITWGGRTLNTLLAALFVRQLPRLQFSITPYSVLGPIQMLDISLQKLREIALNAEVAEDLPVATAAKFTNPSRFINELSPSLAAIEQRNSIPWKHFHRWLDTIVGIEPLERTPDDLPRLR
jgi:ATP-dependent Lhr-like helicase